MNAIKKIVGGFFGLIYEGPKNYILRVMGKPPKPKWLWFGVTDLCNSKCVHCNIWCSEKTKTPLTTEDIEKFFQDPLLSELETIIFSGGEPVLRNDLEQIIISIHKNMPKAKVILSTNGLLPDKVVKVTEFALNNGVPFEVGVSLDGVGEEHDRIRGVEGNFQKVDYLFKKLLEIRKKFGKDKFNVTVGLTLSKYALQSLEKVKEYTKNLGLDVLVQWYNTSSYYENVGKDISAENAEMIKVIKSLPQVPVNKMWLDSLSGKSIKFPCFALYTFFVLQWDGSISPCLSLWSEKVGNIRKDSISKIWHSKEAGEVRKNSVKKCQGCLNSWGTGWSFHSYFWRYFSFYIKKPGALLKKLKGE